ncbi:REP element-mobilizing transposase RayT [Aquimarina sp. EL_43]|uniref:REP-associated tyrosine transposase n=1 Tax=unclassified Aquimarina TaxID=2627091 RepID=UPI0018C8F822|nr:MULTISPECIES: transposase [unclassified Aquimarina]MBG6130176.1 REP element-mobilizing transposase RayT [Aquimarina sp. EL_35]MBG6148956.1 REP element-mobilizing transposase RayT [Aquimarina sp. EL_32]MBG6168670.1 REP element-mobilizing transposase RayT [Aquimarina sp. EL_43]
MSTKYKATMPDVGYFITITIVGWIDVFTRVKQKYIIIDSLKYCQEEKGLEVYGYCIMPSHIHMLCKAKEGYVLSDIIRDFKKFTSKKIIETIKKYPESRREWMLKYFSKACEHLKRGQGYKVWQNGYHAEIASSNWFIKQKIKYIHNNPVIDKIVLNPEDYIFSSARNYADLDHELDIVVLNLF